MQKSLSIVLGLLTVLCLTGCEPYALKGRVIHGPISSIQVVPKDELKLEAGLGVNGAVVDITLEPKSLGREHLGAAAVRQDGTFSINMKGVFGAGSLEHEIGVLVRAKGFDSASRSFIMPGRNQRLLITLQKGADRYRPNDPLNQVRPYLNDRLNR